MLLNANALYLEQQRQRVICMNENEISLFAVWGRDIIGQKTLFTILLAHHQCDTPNLVLFSVSRTRRKKWLTVCKCLKVEFGSGKANLDHKQPVTQDRDETTLCGFQPSVLYSCIPECLLWSSFSPTLKLGNDNSQCSATITITIFHRETTMTFDGALLTLQECWE